MTGRDSAVIKRAELERHGAIVRQLGDRSQTSAPAPERLVAGSVRPAAGDAEEADRVRRLVQAMLSGFARQRQELLDEVQPYAVRIAVEVAKRIVRRELQTDPGLITRTVQAAFEQMSPAPGMRVRVHPIDASHLRRTIREVVTSPDQAECVEIVPDESIEQGGCVIEGQRGVVDARLRTQFEEIQARLFDALDTGGRR